MKFCITLFFFLISGFCLPASGFASCVNPTDNAGVYRYNGGSRTYEYCDGASWVAMGPVGDARTGLVGWWKFDDGSGSSAVDSTGNGNTGTLTNSPTWTTGMNGGALTFNGTTQYVSVPDVASLRLSGPWTVSTWFNLASLPAVNNFYSFLDKIGDVSGDHNYRLFIVTRTGPVYQIIADFYDGTGYDVQSTYTFTPATGTWYHLAGTWDGTTLTTYLNGVPVATDTPSGHTPVSGAGTFQLSPSAAPLPGTLDDARVYNRALSAADVMTLYTSTGPLSGDIQSNLVGWWKFDEASGTLANDSTGNGNSGTLAGTTLPTWGAGKINNALTFNGVDDEVDVPSASVLKPATAFTVAAWVKPTSTSDMAVVKSPDGTGFGTGWRLTLSSTTGVTTYITTSVSGNTSANVGSTVAGQWSHVAFVYDGNFLTAYLNGVAGTPTPATGTVTYGASDVLKIGKSSGVSYFSGIIDDVRIYNRALSASDMLTLYNAYAAACAGPVGYTGDLMYNAGTYHVPQFCNGTNWIPMGPVSPAGGGGGGCSSPAGNESDMMYNNDKGFMQYCDGTHWRAIGHSYYGPQAGLVGWWKFDETSGTTASDSSGNGNTGTLTNGPAWTTSGQVNGALTFANVSNNYVDVANPANFAFERTQPFSLAFWAYRTSSTSEGDVVSNQAGPGSHQGYGVSFPADGAVNSCSSTACSTNCINMQVINTKASNNYLCVLVNGSAAATNAWHHVVATYDGSSMAAGVNIYVDGVLQTPSFTFSNLSATILTGGDLKIGVDVPGHGDTFTGTIDDVRVYNRALSASEIWQLYLVTGGQ